MYTFNELVRVMCKFELKSLFSNLDSVFAFYQLVSSFALLPTTKNLEKEKEVKDEENLEQQ